MNNQFGEQNMDTTNRIARKEYIIKFFLLSMCWFFMAYKFHFIGLILLIPYLLLMGDIIIKRSHDLGKKGYIPVVLVCISSIMGGVGLFLPTLAVLRLIAPLFYAPFSLYNIFFLIIQKGVGDNQYGKELKLSPDSVFDKIGAFVIFWVLAGYLFITVLFLFSVISGFIK